MHICLKLEFRSLGRKLWALRLLSILNSHKLWVFWTHMWVSWLPILFGALTFATSPTHSNFYHCGDTRREINWGGGFWFCLRGCWTKQSNVNVLCVLLISVWQNILFVYVTPVLNIWWAYHHHYSKSNIFLLGFLFYYVMIQI